MNAVSQEYKMKGMLVTNHELEVPLDWRPANKHSNENIDNSSMITLFAREVVDINRADDELPLLLFLQGGPGGKSPRPMPSSPPWMAEALKTHRIILIDQRGTGRSSRIDTNLISKLSAEEGRDYLLKFRADSIVADCEYLRKTIYGGRLFETLGQSYGGFITLTYLSQAPEGLAACYITGGLAGLEESAQEVYQLTYQRVIEKNQVYYARYPEDAKVMAKIAKCLTDEKIFLPDGDQLTLERFQSIGILLGMGPGIDQVHWLVDEAFAGSDKTRLSDVFLEQVMNITSYHEGPLFAVIHESIYGRPNESTSWAAQQLREQFSELDKPHSPLMLTGEMIYPWMFEQITSLRSFAEAANALAGYQDYAPLYDLAKLAENKVPVVAAVYHNDMYVPRELSLKTAQQVANTQVWLTNSYEHDGVRQSPEVFCKLRELLLDQGGPLKSPNQA
ncbi:alpha/beta fold hydrolase [Marinomonas rhizomae]|uniref:Proline iminopeptidase n=1 Tax=Marinomonas rhizomae TaxID=491948 RepID=A0A366IWJ0_9GAMM|nr:alpha/beta fold hydrolase [Marinomonas rhizomae]RBP79142.1 proline iminopeptidase [Marinomonas rhizomae]RNF70434.1 alpha/beta fold hydrolase [Marinomonas rhizomae]